MSCLFLLGLSEAGSEIRLHGDPSGTGNKTDHQQEQGNRLVPMSAARRQMISGSRSDNSQGLLGQTAADSCARSCSADDHAAGESTLMLLLSRSWPWNFKGQYRGCRLEDLQDFCYGFDLVMKVFPAQLSC